MTMNAIAMKVQKLLELAKSSNEHEAALAAAKARELLTKHNLDMAEVLAVKEKEPEGLLIIQTETPMSSSIPQYMWDLANAVAKSFQCDVISRGGENGRVFVFIGTTADSEVAAYTFNYLRSEIERLAKQVLPELKAENPYCRTQTLSYDYKAGAIQRICHELRESSQALQEKDEASCTALMVLKEDRVNQFVKKNYPRLRHTYNSPRYSYSQDARTRGFNDGAGIRVRPGVRQGSTTPRLQ
jgi:hypothetical protein